MPEGTWSLFFENGRKSEEITHNFTKAIIENVWDMTGNQIVAYGTGTYKTFSLDVTILTLVELKNGNPIGVWRTYHQNGELATEGRYENDIFILNNAWDMYKRHMIENGNGFYTSYYSDGETVYENGEYKNGLKEGYWKANHETTPKLFQESNYVAGKLNGIQKQYYESGAVAVEGEFTNDSQNGKWNWFFEDGTLSSTVTFVDGKKEGVQTFWNEWGKKTKEEIHKKGEFVKEKLFL